MDNFYLFIKYKVLSLLCHLRQADAESEEIKGRLLITFYLSYSQPTSDSFSYLISRPSYLTAQR